MKKIRLNQLDIFRGYAIILMMFYHFAYDLNMFGYIHANPNKDTLWQISRYIIVTIFLLSMGMSLKLLHKDNIRWDKVKKRALILGGASIIVTISTYIEFPRSWVYFGILHFVFVGSLLALFFLNRPKLTIITTIFIFIASFSEIFRLHYLYVYLYKANYIPQYTQDFLNMFPWFGVILLGILMIEYNLHSKLFNLSIFKSKNIFNKTLAFLGRHSLITYLIHLPIIFGLFLAVRFFQS